jgi:hypothetical protein
MFNASATELATLDQTLEPLLARASERAAETEQLAMDATRLLSVRPDQLAIVVKQPFFNRLLGGLTGNTQAQTTAAQTQLFEMQRLSWRYLQLLNERELMIAHTMITVKNNLLTLAVKETETRDMLTVMANRIAERFTALEQRVETIEIQQNIHSWLLTLDAYDYPDRYPAKLRMLRVIQDFFALKAGNWTVTEIKYLQKALKEVELPWREGITLGDFIDGLIDEIDEHGFDAYEQLVELNGAQGQIEHRFILDNISVPSHKALYKIADSYSTSSDTIDLLADQLSITRREALKRVLRGFIEKEGIDTSVAIPVRDLAVELLGCHGLVLGLSGITVARPTAINPNRTTSQAQNQSAQKKTPNPTAIPDEIMEKIMRQIEQAQCLNDLDVDGWDDLIEKSLPVITTSADQGYTPAQFALSSFYHDTDASKAIAYLRKAADGGLTIAQLGFGLNCLLGLDVAEDHAKAFEWFSKAANQDNAEGYFWLARCYEDGWGVSQNQERTVEFYTKSAKKGYADAQISLGHCYLNGLGVVLNHAKAFEWFSKAADQDDAEGYFWLARCYEEGWGISKNQKRAIEFYMKSAEQGNENAQINLGRRYLLGDGVAEDHSKAFECFSKAADQDNAEGFYFLADCYSLGWGVSENQQRAVELYTKSAEKGYADAQVDLGLCYLNGRGVAVNQAKAFEWFSKAADQDNATAQFWLARYHEAGWGVSQNQQRAVEFYTKSAEQGNENAQVNLGVCYLNAEDYSKAFEWFSKAADQDDSKGYFWVARCYEEGWGISDNQQRAIEFYTKSAEQGNENAQVNLGYCYLNGRGVAVNQAKALEWFSKAADQGSTSGQIELGDCYARGFNIDSARLYWDAAAQQGEVSAIARLHFHSSANTYIEGFNLEIELSMTAEISYVPDSLENDILVLKDDSVFASSGEKGWVITNSMFYSDHTIKGHSYNLLDLNYNQLLSLRDGALIARFVSDVKRLCNV